MASCLIKRNTFAQLAAPTTPSSTPSPSIRTRELFDVTNFNAFKGSTEMKKGIKSAARQIKQANAN